MDVQKVYPFLRHLENLRHISARNKPGYVGVPDIDDKIIAISTVGVEFFEESKFKTWKTWLHYISAGAAVIISIIALLKD